MLRANCFRQISYRKHLLIKKTSFLLLHCKAPLPWFETRGRVRVCHSGWIVGWRRPCKGFVSTNLSLHRCRKRCDRCWLLREFSFRGCSPSKPLPRRKTGLARPEYPIEKRAMRPYLDSSIRSTLRHCGAIIAASFEKERSGSGTSKVRFAT